MASPFTPPTIPGAAGYPLGLTGATAATRYVGGTTSGAPASGTFAVGDFIIDETGAVYVCTVAGSPGTWVAVSGGGGLFDAYALLRDEKASGTNGGTFTSGAWRTHDLTVEAFDVGGIVSLSANQFTLGAGTYFLEWWIIGYTVQYFQSRIYNATDTAEVAVGRSGWAWANAADSKTADSISPGSCRLTIAGSKAFELQGRCGSTFADIGLGVPTSWGTECYAEVAIYREA